MAILRILWTALRFRWDTSVLGGTRASVLGGTNQFHVRSRWDAVSVLGGTPTNGLFLQMYASLPLPSFRSETFE